MIWKFVFVCFLGVLWQNTVNSIHNYEHEHEHEETPKLRTSHKHKKGVISAIIFIKKQPYIEEGKFIKCHESENNHNCLRAIDCHEKLKSKSKSKLQIKNKQQEYETKPEHECNSKITHFPPMKNEIEYHSCKILYDFIHPYYPKTEQNEQIELFHDENDSLSSSADSSDEIIEKPYHYPVKPIIHQHKSKILDISRCTISIILVDMKLLKEGELKKCPSHLFTKKNKNIYDHCRFVTLVFDCPKPKKFYENEKQKS